jgi:hypothetical protein
MWQYKLPPSKAGSGELGAVLSDAPVGTAPRFPLPT